jgi:hypothetical protein
VPYEPPCNKSEYYDNYGSEMSGPDVLNNVLTSNQNDSTDLTLMKKSKFRLLESLYYSNPTAFSTENRKKIYEAIVRRNKNMEQKCLEQQHQQIDASSSDLNPPQPGKLVLNRFGVTSVGINNAKSNLTPNSRNLVMLNPTPDEKKRFHINKSIL